MTTPPIQTLTDELLGEIEHDAEWYRSGATVQHTLNFIAEIRRLRLENITYRETISKTAMVLGAYVHEECSPGFMAMLPLEATSVVGKLRAGNAELRKDAGRYQALRNSLSGTAGCSHTQMPRVSDPMSQALTYTPTGLDRAIDNAMEQAK